MLFKGKEHIYKTSTLYESAQLFTGQVLNMAVLSVCLRLVDFVENGDL